jgi:hypothetical protein
MSQNDSANPVKNVLFVHGAFADSDVRFSAMVHSRAGSPEGAE